MMSPPELPIHVIVAGALAVAAIVVSLLFFA